MNVAILGFGREGKSILQFLKRARRYRGAHSEILDQARDKNYLKNLKRFDLIFRSPGIPYQTPALFRARCDGVKFSSATRLFFEHASTRNIIGITGSKGKGTTATILYKIMKAAKKDVHLTGNIGKPALDLLPRLKKTSWVILELSSFQLQDLPHSPHIAVVLDTFPEHLDHHKSLREYYGSKTNIVRFQKSSDIAFFAKDNAVAAQIAKKSKGKKMPIDIISFSLFAQSDLRIPGAHNFKNAAAAARIAQTLGIPDRVIRKAVLAFRGNEHRLELVRKIGNISFWNDSASTNPHTTIAAIKSFPNAPKILIAGGQDKGLDYRPLGAALKNSDIKLMILFGENKKKIHRAIRSSGTSIKLVPNLSSAVSLAYRSARLLTTHYSLLSILFSPGATSFDQFKNYADRGEKFKELVKKLKTR